MILQRFEILSILYMSMVAQGFALLDPAVKPQ